MLDNWWRLCYNKTIRKGQDPTKEDEIMKLWMNKETGHLLTYDEMVKEAAAWYDLGDDTNVLGYGEYYTETDDDVPDDWEGDPYDDDPDDIDSDCGFDPYEGCFTWDC